MRTLLSFVPIVFVLACGKDGGSEQQAPPASPPTGPAPAAPAPATQPPAGADAVAKAKEIYAQRCVPCHGPTGAGDGPASASLDPKPRDFGDAAWQASVTDEHIEKIIKYGGAAVGRSAAMPSNPDLNDPAVITALRDLVRGFRQ